MPDALNLEKHAMDYAATYRTVPALHARVFRTDAYLVAERASVSSEALVRIAPTTKENRDPRETLAYSVSRNCPPERSSD